MDLMHYFTLNSIKEPDKCPSFWSRDKSFLGPGKCPVTFTINNFGIKGLVRDQNLLIEERRRLLLAVC